MSMEWRIKGASPPVKPLMQKSISTKVVAPVFCNGQGVIHIDYLNPGETVTTRYITALSNLQQALRHRRCGKLTRGILFHHDNAPTHRSRECVSALSQHGFKTLPHPLYSPDLSPCDFHLFPQIKRQLNGRRFKDIGELKQAFEDAIAEKPTDFFEGAFQTWAIEQNAIHSLHSLQRRLCRKMTLIIDSEFYVHVHSCNSKINDH